MMTISSLSKELFLKGSISGKTLSIFCTHGHQGDGQSDGNFFSKFFISKIWAPLQAYLHINPNTPAYNVALKTEHNKLMYEWSSEQKGMLLITGHTHQPVFESFTHFERLQRQKDNNLYKDIKPSYFNTGVVVLMMGTLQESKLSMDISS